MASYLEQVPRDILVNIAYLCATPSIADLCNLILANSSIYQSLSIRTCPHLYARIFRSKFDVGCRRVRACRTDSALAGELLHRCFALRRVRKRAFSGKFLSWDLRTILQMLIEGGEKNDEHLYAVGFSEYILDLVQQRSEIHFDGLHHTNRNDCDALIVWLLCFTLSRSRINEIGEHTQQTILDFLRPFTLPTFAIPVNTEPPCFCDPSSDRFVPDYNEALSPSSDEDPCQVKDEYRVWRLTCPYPSCPAIILTFSLIEARPFSLPQRLREGPSNQPQGPTLQDFRDVLNEQHMTLLFADVKRSAPTAFWDALDLEFRLMLRDQSISAGAFRYNPGQLAGLWEGRYAVASLPAEGEDALDFATPRDFPAGKFMQCMFDEYLCFGPNDPIPPVDLEDWETDPNFIARSENGLYCCSKEYRYERYTGHSVNSWSEDEVSEQLLDIVILGEVSISPFSWELRFNINSMPTI
ncbi:hypothetical protein AX16_008743 [Volvariella volvacea WC 439]|nr:hypothetical protein AX16_008743 [Volvariella volvacea WC 439]